MKKKSVYITCAICILIIASFTLTTKVEKRVISNRSRVDSSETSSDKKDVSSNNSEQSTSQVSNTQQNNNSTNESNSSKYKDGVYEGSGKGYKSDIKVRVYVSSGKISNIEIVDGNDDPEYFNKAKEVINEVMKNQSTNVDTVSGATFSSNGILDAIDNALSNGGA